MTNEEIMEIIELTDTARLVVRQDEDAYNPRVDWEMVTGALTIGQDFEVTPVHGFPGDLERAHEELSGALYSRGWEQPVIRWARIFHGIELEWDNGTYWWVDPAKLEENWPASPTGNRELIVPNPTKPGSYYRTWQRSADVEHRVIEGDRRTYEMWRDGDVSGVILQRLQSYAKYAVTREIDGFTVEHPDRPALSDEWEDVDSIWGNYLDDKYTAQQVALEHFDLTDEEAEAART